MNTKCSNFMEEQTEVEKVREFITLKRRNRHLNQLTLFLAVFVIFSISIKETIIDDTDWERIGTFEQVLNSVARFMDIDWSLIPHLGVPMLETFIMACLGTLLGLFLSLPVAWLGALNVTPSKRLLYPFARFLMTFSRSIHEMVWALIFVAAVGLGALPGILAIAMRSVGFISKIIAEAIENIDHKPMEAIRSVGGNGFQVMMYGVIPQIKNVVYSTIIFEWDINIRRSAIMGLVGAGGLGLTFFRQMSMYNYGGVTMVILAVLSLILIGEIVSHYTKKALN